MAPSSQTTTTTEYQACPFCLPAAVLAESHLSSPASNGTNFENGLLMSPHRLPGAHSVFGLHCICHTVPSVTGELREVPSSGSGHSGGTWETLTGNHKLRGFGPAHSVSPSLGWKLAAVVTKHMHFTISALTWPKDVIPMFLVYRFIGSSAHDRRERAISMSEEELWSLNAHESLA